MRIENVIRDPEIPGIKTALILESTPHVDEVIAFDHWLMGTDLVPYVSLGRISLTEYMIVSPTNHPAILITEDAPDLVETMIGIKITNEAEVY